MERLLSFVMMLCICLMSLAQKPKTNATTQKKQATTQKSQTAKKPQTSQKSAKTQPSKKGNKSQSSQKAQPSQKTQKSQSPKKAQPKQPSQKEQLQAEQKKLKQDIAANQRQKADLEKRVKKQLQDVFILGSEIDEKRRVIDTIRTDIAQLDSNLLLLNLQLDTLRQQLADRQERYAQSVRYLRRNHNAQSKMMFMFSAKNVNQMYRRSRFMDEYATYQKAQGEAVKQKQDQVELKLQEISETKSHKHNLLARGRQEQQHLERKQTEQRQLAQQLQKEQKTVSALIVQQQKEEAALNDRIEKLIAEEIAREKARIEAEKKRRAEEQARKERERKEKERKERERKLALAKEREAKAKAEAEKARTQQEKTAANKRAKDAERERKAAEKDIAAKPEPKKPVPSNAYTDPDPDQKLSGSFTSNKGRLPMPITGSYQVVRRFGANVIDSPDKNVHLSSKGIYLKGKDGAQARCVFDGQVSGVFAQGNSYVVMVRHGKYITVYCDLANVSVKPGQKVSTNQTLGNLGASCIMQFQLRRWTDLLNPLSWLRK